MSTKMHRIVVYVHGLNGNEYTEQQLKSLLRDTKYLDVVRVGEIKTVDIGEYEDEHPLNHGADPEQYFK